jgi:hypothetical protein
MRRSEKERDQLRALVEGVLADDWQSEDNNEREDAGMPGEDASETAE